MSDPMEELVSGARELHTQPRRWNDRWLLIGGGVALALGLIAIVLGWYGSAQSTLEFEQTPYLISGGILGLALVITGGLVYFSYWLTVLVRENRVTAARTAAHQDRLESLLAGFVTAQETALVMTEHGSVAHRVGCPATVGHETRPAPDGADRCELCR
jgi:hypothetical protein